MSKRRPGSTEQGGDWCFICDDPIDLVPHKSQLDVDHTDPLAAEGLDAENNSALTPQSCNRSKGAANLQTSRIKEFERLQGQARDEGKRGANLGDVLAQHGSAQAPLRLRTNVMIRRALKPLRTEGWIQDGAGKAWTITAAGRRAADQPSSAARTAQVGSADAHET